MNITASELRAQHAIARAKFPFIDATETAHGLPHFLLYAVGSRESNLRNIAGDFSKRPGESSPRFHGFGIWQRDSGAFGVGPDYLDDVVRQADDAASLLASLFARFGRWDAAVAAYNAGGGAVATALSKGRPVDSVTTGHDYSADVLARRSFLEDDGNGAVHGSGHGNGVVIVPAGVHIVKAGETLSGIAAKFHTTVAALVALNHIANPNLILIGQLLKIPAAGAGHATAQAPQTHVVKAGDTLTKLAHDFHTSVERLVSLNHLPDPDKIFVGQVLLVA
jgi:LysM repeat protein